MSKGAENLSIFGHLFELRDRLIKCTIAVVICTIVSFVFARHIFEILLIPAPDSIELVYTQMTGFISIYMKVALAGGIILAMPVLIYQGIMFVSPGLSRQEKKYIFIALPWITLMFFGGVAFTYYIMLPPVTNFLLTWQGFSLFGSDAERIAEPMITVDNYISLVTRFIVAIGITFEMPVIITFLARIGIVKPEWLSRRRRWAIVGAFIVAALITPTFDPINQSMVAAPLIVLYEMSIWLAKLAYKKRAVSEEKDYLAD